MKPDESNEEKPINKEMDGKTEYPLGVLTVVGDGDELTTDQRRKINEALQSGEAKKLLDDTGTVHLEAIDTDAQQLILPIQEAAQRKRNELAQKREAKEISQHDVDLNFLYRLSEIGSPLTRKDLVSETGNQAVVLNKEELEVLGCLDFIHVSGERMSIKHERLREGDILILYPDELGNEEGKPYLHIEE